MPRRSLWCRWYRWMALSGVVGALGAFPALAGGRGEVSEPRPGLVVEVEYGESLWTIAREHGNPAQDVRETVWRIRRANGVDAGRLRPGSRITIPAECLPE